VLEDWSQMIGNWWLNALNFSLLTTSFKLKMNSKMKKSILAIILIGLTIIAVKSNANSVKDFSKTNLTDSVKKNVVDPVCKMKLKANASKTTVYNRVTYSFCSESCKQKFVAEPAKYVKK